MNESGPDMDLKRQPDFGVYRSVVVALDDQLRDLRSSANFNRVEAIGLHHQIAEALVDRATTLISRHREFPDLRSHRLSSLAMELYEENRVYRLLTSGWGLDLYSSSGSLDRHDERLFRSLVSVTLATRRIMEQFDLDKRAHEALQRHLWMERVLPLAQELITEASWTNDFFQRCLSRPRPSDARREDVR